MNLSRSTTVIANVMSALAAMLAISDALAINKCIGPNGRPVFQDAPCPEGRGGAIDVKPASGYGQTSHGPSAGGSASGDATSKSSSPQTEAQRIEAQIAQSQRQRRKQELEVLLVPAARGRVEQAMRDCESQLAALRSRKALANNNLAGATWENSISSEMIAVSTQCDTRTRTLQSELDAVLQECHSLGGCK